MRITASARARAISSPRRRLRRPRHPHRVEANERSIFVENDERRLFCSLPPNLLSRRHLRRDCRCAHLLLRLLRFGLRFQTRCSRRRCASFAGSVCAFRCCCCRRRRRRRRTAAADGDYARLLD